MLTEFIFYHRNIVGIRFEYVTGRRERRRRTHAPIFSKSEGTINHIVRLGIRNFSKSALLDHTFEPRRRHADNRFGVGNSREAEINGIESGGNVAVGMNARNYQVTFEFFRIEFRSIALAQRKFSHFVAEKLCVGKLSLSLFLCHTAKCQSLFLK